MDEPDCIVIPSHNRREIALRCLRHLRETGVTDWARIVVVDDGSTDGTAEAIRAEFPEVEILPGDGQLWWGGSIRRGMEFAIEQGAAFIFWLNEDCFPQPGALECMREISRERQAIVTAQTHTQLGVFYGGRRKSWKGAEKMECEAGEVIPCDFSAGNCVCLPAEAVRRAGYPRADRIPHQWADHDYGLVAGEHGIPCFIAGDARCDDAAIVGGNEWAEVYESWLLSDRPVFDFWKDLANPKSALYLKARLAHFCGHWGPWGVALALAPLPKLTLATAVRLIVPKAILRTLWSRRSQAWQLRVLNENKRKLAANADAAAAGWPGGEIAGGQRS